MFRLYLLPLLAAFFLTGCGTMAEMVVDHAESTVTDPRFKFESGWRAMVDMETHAADRSRSRDDSSALIMGAFTTIPASVLEESTDQLMSGTPRQQKHARALALKLAKRTGVTPGLRPTLETMFGPAEAERLYQRYEQR